MRLKNNADGLPLQTVGVALSYDEARELMDALRSLVREPMSQQLVSGDDGAELAVWIEE